MNSGRAGCVALQMGLITANASLSKCSRAHAHVMIWFDLFISRDQWAVRLTLLRMIHGYPYVRIGGVFSVLPILLTIVAPYVLLCLWICMEDVIFLGWQSCCSPSNVSFSYNNCYSCPFCQVDVVTATQPGCNITTTAPYLLVKLCVHVQYIRATLFWVKCERQFISLTI